MTDRPMTPTEQLFAEIDQVARAALMGLPVDVDPDVADFMGAFEEDAIDADEAEGSSFDVDPQTGLIIEAPDTIDDEEQMQ